MFLSPNFKTGTAPCGDVRANGTYQVMVDRCTTTAGVNFPVYENICPDVPLPDISGKSQKVYMLHRNFRWEIVVIMGCDIRSCLGWSFCLTRGGGLIRRRSEAYNGLPPNANSPLQGIHNLQPANPQSPTRSMAP